MPVRDAAKYFLVLYQCCLLIYHVSAQELAVITDITVEQTTFPINLDTSSEYDEFWVRTVLNIKDPSVDVETPEFQQEMEESLAELLYRGTIREEVLGSGNFMAYKKRRRRKRFAQYNDVSVQMARLKRGDYQNDKGNEVDLVYYMVEGNITTLVPNHTDAQRVVYLMSLFDIQEVAIALGYPVLEKAELYNGPDPDPEPMYWIIGVVLGGLVFIALLVWCILFIYFKCTRKPAKRSPRGSISHRNSRVRTTSSGSMPTLNSQNKNSKQEQNVYNTSPDDTDVTSEAPVKKSRSSKTKAAPVPVVKKQSAETQNAAPKSKQRNGTHRPPPSHEAFEEPVYAVVNKSAKKKKKQKLEDIEESDTEASETEDSQETPAPSLKSSRRKKLKSRSTGRNKEERGEREARPVSKTVHQIKLPPLQEQPLVTTLPPETIEEDEKQLRASLRYKARVEREKNKERQRARRSARRARALPGEQDEYEQSRRQIDAVLAPEVHSAPKKKKKKRPKKSYDVDKAEPEDHMEMSDMFGPSGAHAQYKQIQPRLKQHEEDVETGAILESDSSASSHAEEPLEEARVRMHALLDDAFALVSPQYRSQKMYRGDEMSRAEQGEGRPSAGARHVPMQVPTVKRPGNVHQAWSPYAAADVAAQLPYERPPRAPARDSRVPTGHVKPVSRRPHSAHPGYSNPAYKSDENLPRSTSRSDTLATEPGEPIHITTRTPAEIRAALQPSDYTSITMDARVFAPESYRNRAEEAEARDLEAARTRSRSLQDDLDPHFVRNGSYSKRDFNRASQQGATEPRDYSADTFAHSDRHSNADYLSHPSQTRIPLHHTSNGSAKANPYTNTSSNVRSQPANGQNSSATRLHNQPRGAYESELDVVNHVMQPGVTSEPLVASIREELERLSSAPKQDSIYSFH